MTYFQKFMSHFIGFYLLLNLTPSNNLGGIITWVEGNAGIISIYGQWEGVRSPWVTRSHVARRQQYEIAGSPATHLMLPLVLSQVLSSVQSHAPKPSRTDVQPNSVFVGLKGNKYIFYNALAPSYKFKSMCSTHPSSETV